MKSAVSDPVPNPQGKGSSSTLSFLQKSREEAVLPDIRDDSLARVIEDYLNTLFVLSCEFKFKPVPRSIYYAYSRKERFVLSLVGPDEGGEEIYDEFLGECWLNPDMSWSITAIRPEGLEFIFAPELIANLGEAAGTTAAAGRLQSLLDSLRDAGSWRFDSRLGYYQNAMLYLAQKALRTRCRRLKRHGLNLSGYERQLLEMSVS